MFIDTVIVLMLKSKIFIFIINNKLCYIVYIVGLRHNASVYKVYILTYLTRTIVRGLRARGAFSSCNTRT